MKKAILFDLDGTLLDTAPDLVNAVNALRAEYSLPALPFKILREMVGRGAHNLIRRALTHEQAMEYDVDEAYKVFAKQYHRVNGDETREYLGVTEALRVLLSKGYKLAVVTNKPTEFTLPLLERFGWAEIFTSVVCGDTLPIRKPNPEPLLHALSQLKLDTHEALMVGDSMNDALAAQAAACDCVMLDYGYNEGEPIRESLKDTPHIGVFSSFKDALASQL